jgi:uncharacterized protein YqjF (DUF2071 family)
MTTPEAQLAARQPPDDIVVGRQRWNDLLFLHWKVDPQIVQATLPTGLIVDTYQGAAYLGIVPFFMERVRPRWLPPVPGLSWFQELNVRTYVHDEQGRPGVLFYSLDCNQPIAVWIAQRAFHLPYFHARMSATRTVKQVDYHCQRKDWPEAGLDFSWRMPGETREAVPGSLEFFLVERYYLFTSTPDGQLYSGQVHHRPYRICDAEVLAHSTVPATQAGFHITGEPVSALGAEAVDVSIYPLRKCTGN